MRTRFALLAAAVILGGCGQPPDEATSGAMVERTVLDWHRYQAVGDGEAACKLLTGGKQEVIVNFHRRASGSDTKDSCEAVVDGYARYPAQFRELMRNTVVDSVRIAGERATAVAHTSATVNGVTRATPPATITLRWVDGRWLLG